jgi:hypothetical protein
MNKLTIPARTEMIVRLPVSTESHVKEGLVEKSELLTGVYLADSLVKVNNGHVITSVLNTREQDIKISNPKVQLIELEDNDKDEVAVIGLTEQSKDRDDQSSSRGEKVTNKLRTTHLNDKEKKPLFEICFDYQDVFSYRGIG